MSETIGYIRISTTNGQNTDMQLDEMKKAGIAKVFIDEGVSGIRSEKPQLEAALAYLREGDTLAVFRLDRLGRKTLDVLTLVSQLKDRGISFKSLTEGISTDGFMGTLMITLLSAFAEMEYNAIAERSLKGREAARARGKLGGRKPSLSPQQRVAVMKMYRSKEWTIREIAENMGCSQPTIYRCIQSQKASKK